MLRNKIVDKNWKPTDGESLVDESLSQQGSHYLQRELYHLLQTDPLLFEFLQSDLTDGMWYWDLHNIQNEWMNDRFWEVLGYDPSDKMHLAAEWQDIIFPDDLKLATDNFHKHLKNPAHPYDQYVRYRHKDGSTVWIRCRGIAIYNVDGVPIRFLGIHINTTDIMRQQEALLLVKTRNQELQRNIESLHISNNLLQDIVNNSEMSETSLSGHTKKTGLLPTNYFYLRLSTFVALANRLNQPLNTIIIHIDNNDNLVKNFGRDVLASAQAIIFNEVSSKLTGAVISELKSGFLCAVTIGHTENELEIIKSDIESLLSQRQWSIVSPELEFEASTYVDISDESEIKESVLAQCDMTADGFDDILN